MNEDQIRRLLWCQEIGLLIWYVGMDSWRQIGVIDTNERDGKWRASLCDADVPSVDLYACDSGEIMVTPGPVDWNNGLEDG